MVIKSDIISRGINVFEVEIDALEKTKNCLNETFADIVEQLVSCNGKVVITGMGKSGHIARKMAATFSSLGISSFMLHPGEAMHGDLGMIGSEDVVIAISNSGESDEIVKIIPIIKMQCKKLIGITCNENSTLAKMSDIVQVFPKFDEACILNLAPTSSTTVTMAYGDALAVAASQELNFTKNDFGLFHPAGSLGKKLILKVKNIMSQGENLPKVKDTAELYEAINEIGKKGLGIVVLNDENEHICGVITDGDLRRAMINKIDIYNIKAIELASLNPCIVNEDMFAVDALKLLREKNISSCLVVNDDGLLTGVITINQILKTGIVL